MVAPSHFRIIILLISIILISTAFADTPDSNDIPTLAMRTRGSDALYSDLPITLLCELSWLNFDAINFNGWSHWGEVNNLMGLCDDTGLYYSYCPGDIMQYLKEWANPEFRYWFRNNDVSLTSDSAFARCDATYENIVQYMPAESLYYADTTISIKATIDSLANNTGYHPFLWFYEVYDEANAQQGSSGANYQDPDSLPYDDYIPNVYTQARDPSEIPTLEEVEASGIFSVQKYYAENDTLNPVTFTMNFALIHHIDSTDYTGLNGDRGWATMATQARSVRAMMEVKYQPPPENGEIPDTVGNKPEFIMLDYYPFRYVHPDSAPVPVEMCDADWLFLIEHFEEGIDSTVIPAHEYDVPVFYFPQTFGVAGGPAILDGNTLDYASYCHRKPAPQEFRMLCNLALMHQAKGIFPYNLCSYTEPSDNPDRIMSSLLDRHNIPFDAPYEEWHYTGRWPSDSLEYIRPDSLPPWRNGYDPLYEAPGIPVQVAGDPKNKEIWYEWLFEPYGILYNELGDILAKVKTIGPEMNDLWWCSGNYSDGANIDWDPSAPVNIDDIPPVIKVFEDEAQESCYLFYVDRQCVSNDNFYEITFSPFDLPEHADCSTRLLDHSRRFIMDGTYDAHDTVYTFLDTLDAGEGRLVQLFDSSEGLSADVRITSPDVNLIDDDGHSTFRMEATVGDAVTITADFYNMGTESKNNVYITFYDSTDSETLGMDTLRFDGLPYFLPSSCRTTDRSTASFTWTSDSLDIGVHRFTVAAATWHGEPDSNDNSVDFVFLVNPRDYATEVREDPWDMNEGGNNDWNTDDIEAIDFNWDTTSIGWTDSVSGMFEGVIKFDSVSSDLFKGAISLAIPDTSTEYIDTDKYHMLSFAIVGKNPNQSSSIGTCAMFIRWASTDSTYGWKNLLQSTGSSVGNGWDEYAVVGPIDLNSIPGLNWGSGDATDLWLLMQAGMGTKPPKPIDIRIGWIRLEESAQ